MPRDSVWILFLSITLLAGRLGVAALPTKYTWIKVPDGVTYDQDTDSLCKPASAIDIIVFFLGNYVAHAATVVALPGEPQWITVSNMFLVMLWPTFGCVRGLISVFRSAVFVKDPLERAQRAGALIMVTRSATWEPIPGEPMRSMTFLPSCFVNEKPNFMPYFKLCQWSTFFKVRMSLTSPKQDGKNSSRSIFKSCMLILLILCSHQRI